MAYNQIPVIMNVSFADPRSYDFCCNGIEQGGVIATGSLGTIKKPENRSVFLQGLAMVLKRLKPDVRAQLNQPPRAQLNQPI